VTDTDIIEAAEFDAPLVSDDRFVVPKSLEAVMKPIIEMLATVQARLRRIEKSQIELGLKLIEMNDALWGMELRDTQQD